METKKQDAQTGELRVQKLEERITPKIGSNHRESLLAVQTLEDRITPRIAANHNESLLLEG